MELTNKLKLEMKDSNPQPQPTILRFLNKFEYTSCYWSVQFRGDKRKGRYKKYEIGDKIRHNSNSHKLNVHIRAKISLWCNKTDWRTYKNLFGLAESIQEFSFLHSFVETWGYQDTELLTTATTTNLHCPPSALATTTDSSVGKLPLQFCDGKWDEDVEIQKTHMSQLHLGLEKWIIASKYWTVCRWLENVC